FDAVEERLAVRVVGLAEMDRPQRTHAVFGDHLARDLDGALDVVRRAGRHRVKQNLFGGAAAQEHRDLIFEILACLHQAVALRQSLRNTERAPRGKIETLWIGSPCLTSSPAATWPAS